MPSPKKSSNDAPSPAEASSTDDSQRLYARIAHQIAGYLRAEAFEPGDKLPSETELAERFEVSRGTIREAIVALDVSGVVRLRRHAGAVVGDPTRHLIDGALRREGGPVETLTVRLLVEPKAAQLATALSDEPTRAQLCETLETAIERMASSVDVNVIMEAGDRDFHLAIGRASQNSVLEGVIEDMWRMRAVSRLWRRLDGLTQGKSRRSLAVFEHMRILDAIKAGDAERAEGRMREHVEATIAAVTAFKIFDEPEDGAE